MDCPLRRAEDREGYNRCSDCQVAMVTTMEEAMAVEVGLLREGTSQRTFEKVAGALVDEGIAWVARTGIGLNRRRSWWSYLPILTELSRDRDDPVQLHSRISEGKEE